MLKHFSHTFVRLCGALEVLLGANLLTDFLGLGLLVSCHVVNGYARCTDLFRRNGLLRGLVELLNGLLVVTQILLAADEYDGEALAEVQDLGDPL